MERKDARAGFFGWLRGKRAAARRFRLAAEQGDADALRWYRLAAEQGDADAQFNLGVMYENGRGVTRDDGDALRWYRLAAEQGLAEAQYNLGAMCTRTAKA